MIKCYDYYPSDRDQCIAHDETDPDIGWGLATNIRDWLYVDDHADALLTVLTKRATGRCYTIGAEAEMQNIDLVKMICAILDRLKPADKPYASLISFVKDRSGHDVRYAIDPSRIQQELNWRPATTLEQGLEKTVLRYLANESWWKPLLARDGAGERLGTLPS